MSPSAVMDPYQMPQNDEGISRVLKLNQERLQAIKHEVEDSEYRTQADEYYDAVAISFLLNVAPLILDASGISEDFGGGNTSKTSPQSAAEVAKQVHSGLEKHLEENQSIPIQLPPDYPRESVPHLRSVTRRLWVYLIRDLVLNTTITVSDRALDFIASFFQECLTFARSQPSWKSWEKETDDDLRLSWVLGDHLGEAPPWYHDAAEANDDYRVEVQAYNRSAKFSAYLVRAGFPYHVSFQQSIVFALGTPGYTGSAEAKDTDIAILALPSVFNIAGEVLYSLCFSKFEDVERYRELEREVTKGSSKEYTPEQWKHWHSEAARISGAAHRRAEVREATIIVEEIMKSLRVGTRSKPFRM